MLSHRNNDYRIGLLGVALALGIVAAAVMVRPAAAATAQSGAKSETVAAGMESAASVVKTARRNGFGRRGGDR